MVKTITCDRGTEFANWRRIEERLHCDIYFADPYCAWQKGTTENLNALLREFYPKGRSLSRVAPATLKLDLALINARSSKVTSILHRNYGTSNSIPVALSLIIHFDPQLNWGFFLACSAPTKAPPRKLLSRAFLLYITFRDNEWWRRPITAHYHEIII